MVYTRNVHKQAILGHRLIDQKGDRTWVHIGQRKVDATVDVIQPHHFILRLGNGMHAKVLRTRERARVVKSRMTFGFLQRHSHPGLLRVHERVTGESGNVGFTCETLTPHPVVVGMDPHPLTESLGLLLKGGVTLGGALGIVHASGRTHGDVTPGNVLLRGRTPVLIDFEASVLLGQFASARPNDPDDGTVLATAGCCSPEQASRKRMKPVSDVYCLTMTLLSWVTGEYGVTRNCGDGNILDALYMCARAEYPYWEKVEERIQTQEVIDLLKECIRVEWNREPADGDAFAARCQHLLDTLPQEVLDRAVIDRSPAFQAEPTGFADTAAPLQA